MAYVKKEWKIESFQKGDKELVDSLNHMENGIEAAGPGSEPNEYLKRAEVSGNKLTLTKKDDSQVVFEPQGGSGNIESITVGGEKLTPFEKDVKIVLGNSLAYSDQEPGLAYKNLHVNFKSTHGLEVDGTNGLKVKINQASGTLALDANGLKVADNKFVELPNEPVAGQGLNVPYYFDVQYNESDAIVKDYTVDLLDKTKAPQQFQLRITAASAQQAGLLQASDKFKLDTLNQVNANPTVTSEEQELTSIQIGENKYKLPNNEPSAYIKDAAVANEKLTLTKKDSSTVEFDISGKQAKLTAGDNITIDKDNKISATGNTRTFPDTWTTSVSCEEFLKKIGADPNAKVGQTYQGGINFSDLHDDLGLWNAEAEVEIISSTLSTDYKVIRLNIYSVTNEPYSWARMYFWQGTSTPSSNLKPWQITARAADQYTKPFYTGTCNKTSGVISLDSALNKGVYIINIYGTQSSSQISYTYYFAYGGYQDWMTYSTDSCGTSVSALSGTLTMSRVDGQALNWDADATVEIYKMR